MKRIEFIAPVRAIRGNMSGNQVLQYAEHDNPAYDSPKGQRNYARNYRPSFIGASVSSTGKVYFVVKTKTAVHLTNKSLKAMALQGGTGALVGALLANKDKTPYQQTYTAWLAAVAAGQRVTFRKFASAYIRAALAAGAANITIVVGSVSASFKNPWNNGSMTEGAEVSEEVLVKFWSQLNLSGITFSVDGAKGIAIDGDTFGDLISNQNLNVLGLSSGTVGSTEYVKKSNLWVIKDGDYTQTESEPIEGVNYELTATAPEA